MLKKFIIISATILLAANCGKGCSGTEKSAGPSVDDLTPPSEITEDNAKSEAEKLLKTLQEM